MITEDVIKAKLTSEGYLMEYPYHMISRSEMFDAFIDTSWCKLIPDGTTYVENTVEHISERDQSKYFDANYPLLSKSPEIVSAYSNLVDCICYHILMCKLNQQDYIIPNWIYSYMLGSTISVTSSIQDIHDMLTLMGIDNLDDEFLAEAELKCYQISSRWVRKFNVARPPTIFGEPHVIKSLRLGE